jgi:hypothetical protein
MPVTARLSKHFYDRLGEQIANELVEWFNQVDATYRSDLREVNELNYARFDARVEQRFAVLAAQMAERFSGVDRRFAEVEGRFAGVDVRLAELEASNARRFARVDVAIADLRVELQRGLKEQTRYLLLALTAQMAAIIGLYLR